MKQSSDRSFGLTFAAFCAAAALWTLRADWLRPILFALAGTAFLLTALLAPRLLGPLNRAWHLLGLALGKVTTPIVMGLVFLLVVTPIALLRRARGHDPLRLKPAASYWIDRPGDKPDLTQQF
jgi:Saxitoxin biosynthesis operon protein SxtJ